MGAAPDLLQSASLEWALNHLSKYGDSDLVPVPFEYQAVKSDWGQIKRMLEGRDISTGATGAHAHFLVPKPEGAFRVATRLDPIDALIYTAAVYECATVVEKSRAAKTIACSYRIDPTPDGKLFAAENAWDSWTKRSVELSKEPGITHVVTADISDCYSQLGHHRVCNALENAGVATPRAKSIEGLLGGWSALQSRGVPVGPHVSIVLAEACMNDVDQHLVARGYRHVRYVDDFRIFCRSRLEATRAMHDLCDYLFTSHRLALQPQKSRTYKRETFLARVAERPELIERRKKEQRLQDAVNQWEALGYAVEGNGVDESAINVDVVVELFEECVNVKPVRIGLLRYIFRRAAALRTSKIQRATLDKLGVLVPALRDLCFYLQKAKQKKSAKRVAERLRRFGLRSSYSFLPYVQEWIVQLLTGPFAGACSESALLELGDAFKGGMGIRGQALIARTRNDISWVRQYKERWRALGPWDRRAVIWAGHILKDDERHAWKRAILPSGDPLDRAVALLALA